MRLSFSTYVAIPLRFSKKMEFAAGGDARAGLDGAPARLLGWLSRSSPIGSAHPFLCMADKNFRRGSCKIQRVRFSLH
jgi:hypothetical protein